MSINKFDIKTECFIVHFYIFQIYGEFVPMVAFMCNKPSMYYTENGWQRVENVDCLHDPVDILNFCRRVSV